ncbi:hypothetical protein FB451DRAFT_1064717, partial [Mycena latifolia]
WVAGCDQLKIPIKAKEAKKYVDDYRARKQHTTASTSEPELPEPRTQFSQEAFVDAIVEFIVGDDQSINVVENKQLRAIFLMLRSELRDQDIPHRTTIRKRIIEVWDEHLNTLERELGVSFLHIIDRIRIAHKLGWITLDNASNNDTFMACLERELIRRGIPFCKFKRRIR